MVNSGGACVRARVVARTRNMEKRGVEMAGKRAPQDQRREQILRAAFEVATRAGIGGMSVRAVAAEARLSHALVLFYFGSKQQLVHALLDWLIEPTAVLHVSDEIARLPGARERLGALLRQEI